MFEEIIEPTKLFFSKNISNFPLINERIVAEKYGIEVLNLIKNLRKEFYKSEAWKKYTNDNWNIVEKEFKTDCLKKYPLCCNEIIELFWWGYSFCIWNGAF